jgi:hypothetical protein
MIDNKHLDQSRASSNAVITEASLLPQNHPIQALPLHIGLINANQPAFSLE